MCGIIYVHNPKAENAFGPVLKRYEAQKSRGEEGFGFVTFGLETLQLSSYVRRAEEKDIKKAFQELDGAKTKANACLFHHRYPTSTPNLAECAHPILVDNKELEHIYYVVHNGVLSNEDDLKIVHNALGYEYMTEITEKQVISTRNGDYEFEPEVKFNDSEALAIELARFIDGKSKRIEAKGSMAFVVIQATRSGVVTKLHYGRNYRNPLHLEIVDDLMCLKSEGKMTDIVPAEVLFSYDYLTKETTKQDITLDVRYVYTAPANATAYKDDYEDWEGGMGFRNHHLNLPVKEEEPPNDPIDYGITAEDYLDMSSFGDYDVDTWLTEGYSAEELEAEVYDESYLLDSLIATEEKIIGSEYKKLLQERKGQLDQMIKVLDVRIRAVAEFRDREEEAELLAGGSNLD